MQNITFSKLSHIKPLIFKNLLFNVYNFHLDDIKRLIKYEKILLETVEQKMFINIFFNECEIDLKNLRKYENLSLNLYSQVT